MQCAFNETAQQSVVSQSLKNGFEQIYFSSTREVVLDDHHKTKIHLEDLSMHWLMKISKIPKTSFLPFTYLYVFLVEISEKRIRFQKYSFSCYGLLIISEMNTFVSFQMTCFQILILQSHPSGH